ncbi:NLI interacting factor family phosphatase [Schizosaccharomyces cryophilus OY26]|uniref:Mitochondrial import inner membrane translocase subunit TIM50 n=1 Tax=Schizosaccharomyces cryophilus (strain OY26 / ATCC MYA-4695 / CBS 11777 / NBRC 106824 / NRRL Y48691) TaxID=653667 RepID=S9W5D1_SCHCR|nr:NLI interacting factor family phosphatase [Schizosaccharomyces cryophilus OY26]EPY53140.1 NLI interacting factor family phosphatase [Schizosaccharomyces cryophilus OY26]
MFIQFAQLAKRSRFIKPVMNPKPSQSYLEKVKDKGIETDDRKLLVLDLNGTLLSRPLKDRSHSSVSSASSNAVPRPGVKNFLKYAFTNYSVMVYSSSRRNNVEAMLNCIMNPEQVKSLTACWTRESMGLSTAHFNTKVQTFKNLDAIWENLHQDRDGQAVNWCQYNTVIIDDSEVKCAAHPFNHIHVSDFAHSTVDFQKDFDLVCAIRYLKHLKNMSNVSNYISQHPFRVDHNLSQDENLKYLDQAFEEHNKNVSTA